MITINRGVMRQARRNKHLTWQAVSDLTLIPVGTLLKWRDSNYDISNRPAIDIRRLADALGVSWEELVVCDD